MKVNIRWAARGGAHTAIHTFGRTVGNFDQVNGGPYRQIFELPRSNSSGGAQPANVLGREHENSMASISTVERVLVQLQT